MPIIDGQIIADEILKSLKKKIKSQKLKPRLAMILIGFHEPSYYYFRKVQQEGHFIGITIQKHILFYHTLEEQALEQIKQLNKDQNINGILIQYPLPPHIKEGALLAAIDPEKDVDGFHPINIQRLLKGKSSHVPPAFAAILEILKSTGICLEKKNAVLLVRSETFGKPLSLLLQNEKIKTTIFIIELPSDLLQKKIIKATKQADILISALGSPKLITEQHVKPDSIIVDLGFVKKDQKIIGDVDFEPVSKIARWITPVPRGVGPVTAAMLLKNVVKVTQRK